MVQLLHNGHCVSPQGAFSVCPVLRNLSVVTWVQTAMTVCLFRPGECPSGPAKLCARAVNFPEFLADRPKPEPLEPVWWP